MATLIALLNWCQDQLDRTRAVDFLGPLALRLYLVPILWMAGTRKLANIEDIAAWFGNPDWGLGLPAPLLMAWLATLAEVGGAISYLTGLAVRWMSIPVMVTMLVAAATVHWDNGWLAIAEADGPFATERTQCAVERLERAKEILREHGDYDYLTECGNFVVLNNGIEFAATYFIMALVLFFVGGGRYVSLDYWIARRWRRP